MRRFEAANIIVTAVAIAILAFFVTSRTDGTQAQVLTSELEAYSYEKVTVGATAVGFTAATINPTSARAARAAFCSLETADIRYRYDGLANPTASEGHPVAAGSTFSVVGTNNLIRFRAIRQSGTSGDLRCTYAR